MLSADALLCSTRKVHSSEAFVCSKAVWTGFKNCKYDLKPHIFQMETLCKGPLGTTWSWFAVLSSIISLFAHETAKFFRMKDQVWRKIHSSGNSYLDPRSILVTGNSQQHWVFLPHTVKYLRCSFYRNCQYVLRTNYLIYANLKVVYLCVLSW